MTRIRRDLIGTVLVRVGRKKVFLAAGDQVPEGVDVRPELLEKVEAGAARQHPGVEASRKELDVFARSVGVDPKEYRTKSALLAALEAHTGK